MVGVPPGGRKMSLVEEQSTYALFVIMAAPPMLGCVRPRPRANTPTSSPAFSPPR